MILWQNRVRVLVIVLKYAWPPFVDEFRQRGPRIGLPEPGIDFQSWSRFQFELQSDVVVVVSESERILLAGG